MHILFSIITSAVILCGGFLGFISSAGTEQNTIEVATVENEVVLEEQTVEIGLTEVSPAGEEGGFAIPASGCGVVSHGPEHDCATVEPPEISVNTTIIRKGDPVVITWDPGTNTSCVLTDNIMDLGPTLIEDNNPPNGNVYDSVEDNPTGETTYGIDCAGASAEASVTVKVLPEIQET